MSESDGIDEIFAGHLRVALTAAGQLAERIASQREMNLRRAQAESEAEARALHSRLDAERDAARADVARIYRPDWWDQAQPEEIGKAYETSRSWARIDPEMARAEERIRDEIRGRYGVELLIDAGDPSRLVADAQEARRVAAAEHAEAARLAEAADRADRDAVRAAEAAEFEPDPAERAQAASDAAQEASRARADTVEAERLYDSAERRTDDARALSRQGIDEQAVQARVRADVSQAKPADQAVSQQQPRVAVGKRTRGHSAAKRRGITERGL